MDRAEQEDEQRLREVMCERRSVRISCDESSHAEAVEPPLRPFHTVSERLYEKALSTLKGGSTRLQESTRSCLSRCFWPSAPVLKPLSSLFHTVSLGTSVNKGKKKGQSPAKPQPFFVGPHLKKLSHGSGGPYVLVYAEEVSRVVLVLYG